MSERHLVSSGSRFEPEVGFSRECEWARTFRLQVLPRFPPRGAMMRWATFMARPNDVWKSSTQLLLKLEAHFKTSPERE